MLIESFGFVEDSPGRADGLGTDRLLKRAKCAHSHGMKVHARRLAGSPVETLSQIEPLEARIAPASLLFTDQDGDKVRFTTSRGDLAGLITETIVAGVGTVYSLDLAAADFDGANLTVSVSKGPQGDGIAIVGSINAGANNLGAVKIKGDLGSIDAGGGSATIAAIRSLAVDSFGRFGVYGDGDGTSAIDGQVNALLVKRDFAKAFLSIDGDLQMARIGGSMVGGAIANEGHINVTGSIGSFMIAGDLRGGDQEAAGRIAAGIDIGLISIRGSIAGGGGNNSGQITAGQVEAGRIGKVVIKGSLAGGTGSYSGTIGATSAGAIGVELGVISIGKDLIGGQNFVTGAIQAIGGGIGMLTIHGSFIGGPIAASSGLIFAAEDIGTLTVRGDVLGGLGEKSARVLANDIGTITIGRSLVGGHGLNTGEIFGSGNLGKITIGGDIRGGDDNFCGAVVFGGNIGQATVKGSIYGGPGNNSGSISAALFRAGEIGSVTVGGSVYGGTGISSGTIGGHEANSVRFPVSLGTVTIAGNLHGGSAVEAGSVTAYLGTLDRLTIKGSVIGGTHLAILADERAGMISIGGSVFSAAINFIKGADAITIRGSLIGGAADLSGSIVVNSGGIGVLKIMGDIRGGAGQGSGLVNVVDGGIGMLVIGGAVIPGTGAMSGMIID